MGKKFVLLIYIIFTIGFYSSCHKSEYQNALNQFISIEDKKFIDADGRQVIFHGINLVNKNKESGYLGNEGLPEFSLMREWGFNCIRLGIIWDGLEPQPGRYNEEYLKNIDKRIAWAKQCGLRVILDMHQDLFSVQFSDGAPEWASLTDGKPHIHSSPVWSDAYFSSPAVQTAFDNFWNDAPAPDGIGIQEHFVRLWKHIAQRYNNETAILGYDIMNEPFIGSAAADLNKLMFSKGAELLGLLNPTITISAEELAQKWITSDGRSEILKFLSDVDLYAKYIDSIGPEFADFERTKLMDMYNRVAKEIREVDRKHIIFLETTIMSNMGLYSGIEPIVNRNGHREALQAYAPHGYDLVTDTKEVALANPERIEFIFSRHGKKASKLNMPMLVGEWGAYGKSNSLQAARVVVGQFEDLLCSETYWNYEKNIDKTDYFLALKRPYPAAIAGNIQFYHFDPQTGWFECVWTENPDITEPGRIFVPNGRLLEKEDINLSPFDDGFTIIPLNDSSKNAHILIKPTGKAVKRQLKVILKELR